jgi:hypothetical protein
VRNRARLGEEALHVLICQFSMEHFIGGLGVQIYMRAQVNFSEVPLFQQLYETIVAQLLSHASSHGRTFFLGED